MKKEFCHTIILLVYFITSMITPFKTPYLELFSVAPPSPSILKYSGVKLLVLIVIIEIIITEIGSYILVWEVGFSKGGIICWRWHKYLRSSFFDISSSVIQTNTILRITYLSGVYYVHWWNLVNKRKYWRWPLYWDKNIHLYWLGDF